MRIIAPRFVSIVPLVTVLVRHPNGLTYTSGLVMGLCVKLIFFCIIILPWSWMAAITISGDIVLGIAAACLIV